MPALQRGKQVPNWTWSQADGQTQQLWDWRQKSNVVLIVAPAASADVVRQWQAGIEAERKQWLWLHVQVFLITTPIEDVPAGVYAIDRYGCWIHTWPLEAWTFDDIQREYVYDEARHC